MYCLPYASQGLLFAKFGTYFIFHNVIQSFDGFLFLITCFKAIKFQQHAESLNDMQGFSFIMSKGCSINIRKAICRQAVFLFSRVIEGFDQVLTTAVGCYKKGLKYTHYSGLFHSVSNKTFKKTDQFAWWASSHGIQHQWRIG